MDYPFISVIVPVYNREKLIQNCIESLLSLEYPKDRIEIIIVDNGSSDRTAEIIKRYALIYVLEEKPGVSCARNKGVSISRGDFIAFIDSDCEVSKSWALEIAQGFSKPGISALMGFCPGINGNLLATFIQRRHEDIFYLKTANGYTLRENIPNPLNPRNFAIRREVFDKIGGFDKELLRWEDFDFSRRFNLLEYKVYFNSKMVTYHHNPTDISAYMTKGYLNGRNCFKIIKDRSQGLSEDVLLHYRRFFMIDNLAIRGLRLNLALLFVKTIRFLTTNLLRIFLLLKIDNRFGYEVFLQMFYSSQEIEVLKARREFLVESLDED